MATSGDPRQAQPHAGKRSRLRVGIDLTALLPQRSGIDTYLLELVHELLASERTHAFELFVNRADAHRFGSNLPANFRLHALCARPRPARLLFQQTVLPRLCSALALDVLHSPSYLLPLRARGVAHVLTVHDLTFFSMPQVHTRLRRSAVFRRGVLASIRRAQVINVPSFDTKAALLQLEPRLLAENVHVTPFGVNASFCPASSEFVERERKRLGLPARYVLHLGTIEPRKNLPTLLEAMHRLFDRGHAVSDVHLVLAGRLGWDYRTTLANLAHPRWRGRVHGLGFVPQDDLPAVLRAAEVVVAPSLHEGFGFPPLEAMGCGTPVVSARGSALQENLGDAAELVSPTDPNDLAAAMYRLLTDRQRHAMRREQGLLRAARFRWDVLARDVVRCYETAASGSPVDFDPLPSRSPRQPPQHESARAAQ